MYRHECYCGDSYGKYGEVDKSECFIPCPGDVNYKCGGYRRNSIFSVGKFYSTEPFTSNNYQSNATTTDRFDTSETMIDISTSIQTNIEDNFTTITNFISTTIETTLLFTSIRSSTVTPITTSIRATTSLLKNLSSAFKTTISPKTIPSQSSSFKSSAFTTKSTSSAVKTNSKRLYNFRFYVPFIFRE